MNQSALVGGALLAGFALFLASRDRLSVYGAVLWGAKPAGGAAPDPKDAGNVPASPNAPPVLGSLPSLLNPFDWNPPEGFQH